MRDRCLIQLFYLTSSVLQLQPFQIYDPVKYTTYWKHYYRVIDKAMAKLDPQIAPKNVYATLLAVYQDLSDDLLYDQIFTISMDMYAITRMFIQFEPSKLTRGPKGCQSSQSRDLIFYGGGYHTGIYHEFINRYFKQKPSIMINHGNDGQQCLILPQPFDFFASQ